MENKLQLFSAIWDVPGTLKTRVPFPCGVSVRNVHGTGEKATAPRHTNPKPRPAPRAGSCGNRSIFNVIVMDSKFIATVEFETTTNLHLPVPAASSRGRMVSFDFVWFQLAERTDQAPVCAVCRPCPVGGMVKFVIFLNS